MSKNSAIDIILRVRPHKNVYKGFSILIVTQVWTKRSERLLSSSQRTRSRVISITNKRNGCSNSTRLLECRLDRNRFLIRLLKMLLILLWRVLMALFLHMGRLVLEKLLL